jgi:hypothetical protein
MIPGNPVTVALMNEADDIADDAEFANRIVERHQALSDAFDCEACFDFLRQVDRAMLELNECVAKEAAGDWHLLSARVLVLGVALGQSPLVPCKVASMQLSPMAADLMPNKITEKEARVVRRIFAQLAKDLADEAARLSRPSGP